MQPCGSVFHRGGATVAPEAWSHHLGFGPPACSCYCACSPTATSQQEPPGKRGEAADRMGAGVQDQHCLTVEPVQLHLTAGCGHGAYRKQPVSDLQAPVLLGSTSLDDLGDVDAVIPRDVLVPDAPCNAEPQA